MASIFNGPSVFWIMLTMSSISTEKVTANDLMISARISALHSTSPGSVDSSWPKKFPTLFSRFLWTGFSKT